MNKRIKILSVVLTLLLIAGLLAGCTAVQVKGTLTVNADNSGTREIIGMIPKIDDNGDGYGSCYYYFKLHGDELKAKIEEIFSANVEGSAEWLKVEVDDSDEAWETITMSFDFTSIEDYTAKLKAMAFDEAAAAVYADPTFTRNDDGTFTYAEPAGAATAIFKSLQTAIMADDTVFDPSCTKDGTALNTAASLDDLIGYGVEFIKPENGDILLLTVDGGEQIVVPDENGVFTFTGSASGEIAEVEHETTMVLHYGFDEALTNDGTAADNDLVYGNGSPENGPVFEDAVVGKGIHLDGKTFLASPNKDYKYKEMTVSFYYRFDAYTETDTGANMVIVPAGLGALGAGVIDIEFLKETGAPDVQLMAKMNSVDWMTQDKLFSEEFTLGDKLNEWHHYAIVYMNEYEDGEISDAFVYMYVDGVQAARSRLSVAAGLTYCLGLFDDGAYGDPNGGFNVGGYFEADQVKRACTGCLDELMVFDGALTPEEINALCYTAKVDHPYDPNAEAEPAPVVTEAPVEPEPAKPAEPEPAKPAEPEPAAPAPEKKDYTGLIIGIAAAVVAAAAVIVVVILRRKKKA
ncbi:MAG: hypothetical protein IJK88_10700 [Clostridia bacterium]|nr:hypothetical protein [Clostridia bacterium]